MNDEIRKFARTPAVRFIRVLLLLMLIMAGQQAARGQSNVDRLKNHAAPATGSAEARFGLKFDPVNFTPPTVNHATLASGVTVDHFAEPEIPLVTILVRLRLGSVNDPVGKVGAAAMTGEVIRNGGSLTVSGDALDRQLEARGAQLSVETDREETWFRLSVLKEDLTWGVGLLTDLLSHPAFPQGKLDEARGRSLTDLRQRLDVPQDVARYLYPQLIYGQGNPWGWTASEKSINALTLQDLRAIYDRYYVSGNMKLGFAGDVTWDQARAVAEKSFGVLPRREAPALKLPAVSPVTQTRVTIVPRGGDNAVTQNVIFVGHEGISRFDPEKFPIKVFNSVLAGGFTSRLFKEIRSDRGLAYAVFGRVSEGTVKGTFLDGAFTKVSTTGLTLKLMLQVTNDLRTSPPTEQEVELAKQSEINSFVFFFDSAEKIVRQKMTLDGFGYPPDYLATFVKRLKAVTPAEVQQAAKDKIHPGQVIVLVVGDIDKDLNGELKAMGPVTSISEAELKEKWL